MEIKASTFFTPEQQKDILRAIKRAEKKSSGEIRVHIETSLEGDVMDRAAWVFKMIGMHRTELHNGVLLYLAVKDKKFAIIGDSGINAVVPEEFWTMIRDHLHQRFATGQFAEGVTEAVILTGEQLRKHFPRMEDDVNELPDDISFGDPYKFSDK
jgi:uncharacterized membrane protein